jgi:DNA-binding response OmpR family regulator
MATVTTKLNTKPYILVAEDDKFYANIYRSKFTKEGFDVLVVQNGDEVLREIKLKKPDLLLLDLIMPVKDGFEVLEALQKDEEMRGVKVIVLSNLSQEEDTQRALKLGAKDYFVKANISIQEVIERVKKAIS